MLARLGAAGPSRIVLGAFAYPPLAPGCHALRAGPGPRVAVFVGHRAFSASRVVAQRPRTRQDQAPKLTEREWPWRPVQPPPRGDVTEVERVIFARPVSADPRMTWVFGVLWLTGVVTWALQPRSDEYEQYMKTTNTEPM